MGRMGLRITQHLRATCGFPVVMTGSGSVLETVPWVLLRADSQWMSCSFWVPRRPEEPLKVQVLSWLCE